MCGIAGWINLKSDLTNQKEILNSMIDRLTPRGPDASGSWISPNALIAHKRFDSCRPGRRNSTHGSQAG